MRNYQHNDNDVTDSVIDHGFLWFCVDHQVVIPLHVGF